jgi:CopA family copper-resistance protein
MRRFLALEPSRLLCICHWAGKWKGAGSIFSNPRGLAQGTTRWHARESDRGGHTFVVWFLAENGCLLAATALHPRRVLTHVFSRRAFVGASAALGASALWSRLAPAWAGGPSAPGATMLVRDGAIADLVIAETPFEFGGRRGTAVTLNGTVPGPLLRFHEGDTVTLRVTNRLDEDTSIHWHGLLVPSDQDGVPGLSFRGIRPGETFTYRYHVRQYGTYWYHSHSGFQEQRGHYAPIIIDPAGADPIAYDREHVVQLSDWTFTSPEAVFARLKKQGNYFNFQRRTVADFARDIKTQGFGATLRDRAMWAAMRMDPTDILDVTGYAYTYLMNGWAPDHNWTATFQPGERVRLRFIDSGAQTFFNVRIPGLPMTIVQADGQHVQPVTVDEFQFGAAETYDVIVQPEEDRAYTIFAEAMDRSGYARGTLAPRPGMAAEVPPVRKRPLRTMVDMGMEMKDGDHGGMKTRGGQDAAGGDHASMNMGTGASTTPTAGTDHRSTDAQAGGHTMSGMDHGTMEMNQAADAPPSSPTDGSTNMPGMAGMSPVNGRHGPDTHGPGNTMVAKVQRNRLGEPGTGLEEVGHRVLAYDDLKSLEPARDTREPTREIEMHLTGNMEAFIWGIDGKRFSDDPTPIRVRTGERVRLTLVNDTMMEHPMHLHGVFMELDNGAGAHKPRKHTIIVKPAERLAVEFTYDEPGNFAFHCHMLLHMEAGMFRFFNVSGPTLWKKA